MISHPSTGLKSHGLWSQNMAIVKELTRNLTTTLPPLIHLRESLGLPNRSCPSTTVNLKSKVKCPRPLLQEEDIREKSALASEKPEVL